MAFKDQFKKKMRIIVDWYKEGIFTAIITSIHTNKLYLEFDDGCTSDIPITSKKILGIGYKKSRKAPIPPEEVSDWIKTPIQKRVPKRTPKKVVKKVVKPNPAEDISLIAGTIRKAKKAYYAGNPIMPDKEFDRLEDHLRELDPKHPALSEIGAPIAKKVVGKVELPFYMGSLDKIKPDNAKKWLRSNSGPYVVSDKIDGNSLLLFGHETHWDVFSRGDGIYGQNLFHLTPFLNLPKPQAGICVRVEAAMSKKNFKTLEIDAENARNLVSGLLNRKEVSAALMKKIDIIAFELVEPNVKPFTQFKRLKSMGFLTPKTRRYTTMLDVEKLEKTLTSRRKYGEYEVDGLVITLDQINERVTSGNPKYSIAFKSIDSEQIATVKVVDVLWSPSRHKTLKPRIQIEKTRLSGVTITYLTGFNAKFINDNKIGPGAVLKIVRSGDVIPHILEVVKQAKSPKMPYREYTWSESGVDIYAPTFSKTVYIKRITHFFKTIGVENFSQGLVTRLYNEGFDTIIDIIKAPVDEMIKIEGIGKTMAEKIRNGIGSALSGVELPTLMFASGSFNRDMGLKRLTAIYQRCPNIMDDPITIHQIAEIQGFSDKTAFSFVHGLKRFKIFYGQLSNYVIVKETKTIQSKSKRLQNEAVLFTGFRDNDLSQAVVENGGVVKTGWSNAVTIVVLKDPNSTSSKAEKAREKGIALMSIEEFRSTYRI